MHDLLTEPIYLTIYPFSLAMLEFEAEAFFEYGSCGSASSSCPFEHTQTREWASLINANFAINALAIMVYCRDSNEGMKFIISKQNPSFISHPRKGRCNGSLHVC